MIAPIDSDFRPLTKAEHRVLVRLLVNDFPGRDELLCQLKYVSAKTTHPDGSLIIRCLGGPRAPVKFHLVVDAEAMDSDNWPISVMLFAFDGFLSRLDIVKSNGSDVIDPISPEAINVPP